MPIGVRAIVRFTVTIALVLATAAASRAQAPPPTPLRNLIDDQVVARIGYCRGEYTVTMASGTQHRYPEINLRFKTDGSRPRSRQARAASRRHARRPGPGHLHGPG